MMTAKRCNRFLLRRKLGTNREDRKVAISYMRRSSGIVKWENSEAHKSQGLLLLILTNVFLE